MELGVCDRGVAEPLMGRVGRREWRVVSAARVTCRVWRELIEPHAAARIVTELTAPSYAHRCAERGCQGTPRVSVASALSSHPALLGWATRCLQQAPPRASPRPRVQPCGLKVAPDAPGALVRVARITEPAFVAALKRHVRRSGPSVGAALREAARARNMPMVKWISAKPDLDPTTLLRAMRGCTSIEIVRRLGACLEKHVDFSPPADLVESILTEAAFTGDADLCEAMHAVLEFQPSERVGELFARLARSGNKLGTVQWIARRIQRPALDMWVLCDLASLGDLETMRWMVDTLEPEDEDDQDDDDDDGPSMLDVLEEAIEADHVQVVAFMVERFVIDARADRATVWRTCIINRARKVFAWLGEKFPIHWRSLGENDDDAREVLTDLLRPFDHDFDLGWILLVSETLGLRAADMSPPNNQ